MTNAKFVFEAQVMVDKKKIKIVYGIGLFIFLAAIGCMIWSEIYWEEYTFYVKEIFTGKEKLAGLPTILYYWGLGFVIAMPVLYGLMWLSIDFKHPALGVNSKGIFLNREGFRKTFLEWHEFDRMERQGNGDLWLYMKDPEGVVKRQPAFARPFLSQSFVKTRSPITLSREEKAREIIDLVTKHSGMVR